MHLSVNKFSEILKVVMKLLKLFIVCFSIFSFSGCANYDNMSQSQKQEFWNGIAGGLQGASDALAEQNRRIAAEQEEQRRRQINCTTEFMGSTAYTRCR
jgi:hypothetical protein